MERMKEAPVLAIVVPCYFEEEVLPSTAATLETLLRTMIEAGEVSGESYVCYVNDGSTDATWEIINGLMQKNSLHRGVNLSRNFGHQGAVLAGLFTATADAYVSIDADLQDDEQKIRDMVRRYREGCDIVYGCRNSRETDSWFKRTTAQGFYKLRSWLGIRTIPDHADYRLMSARAVRELRRFGEVNLFLRGVIPMLGFPSDKVFYARKSRQLGESKYPLAKMLKLAWNGLVNFTDAPLRLIVLLGAAGFAASLLVIAWCLWAWYSGLTVPGWASLLAVVSAFSSVQLLSIGIIGLYLSKVFWETKRRPLYVVQDDCTSGGECHREPRNVPEIEKMSKQMSSSSHRGEC